MLPGSKARAARLKRETAYSDESTPGSPMTSLAAAKLLAQRAQRTTTTPRHRRPEREDCSASSPATILPDSSVIMTRGLTMSLASIDAAAGGVEGRMSFSVTSKLSAAPVGAVAVSLSVLKPTDSRRLGGLRTPRCGRELRPNTCPAEMDVEG